MRPLRLSAAIVCLLAMAGVVRAQTNLVTNGGFESGFSGWTVSEPGYDMAVCFTFDGYFHPYSGSFYVILGSPDESYLSQDIQTTIGTQYTVSLELADNNELENEFEIDIGSSSDHIYVDPPFPTANYNLVTANFIASSTTTDLILGAMDNPSYLLLDDVSVTESPEQPQVTSRLVPLPGSFWLGLVAMGALGLVSFARRRRVA
jgi:hypothetical protein